MAELSGKSREMKLRHQATRLGLRLEKDRARAIRVAHMGGWRVTDSLNRGQVIAGSSFELTLADVSELLDARESELASAMQAVD